MNPFISMLLVALGALAVILLISWITSVIIIFASEKIATRQYAELQEKLQTILGGADSAETAQALLEGRMNREECDLTSEQAMAVDMLLQSWQEEKERIRKAAEESNAKRKGRKRWLRSGADKF